MNRLWVRLSVIFSVLILFGVMMPILLSILANQSGVFRYLLIRRIQEPGGLDDQLVEYYRAHQSWDGVENIVTTRGNIFGFLVEDRRALALIDYDGRIIYNVHRNVIGEHVDLENLSNPVVITVDGVTRGYLGFIPVDLARPEPPPKDREGPSPFSVDMFTFLLLMGVFSAFIGIFIGTLMSRSLTLPLSRLAEAARAIGAHNLSQRVAVKGNHEINEVARAFNEMAAGLEEGEILRRNLVADVAHELRTPLTVLQGSLRAILDDVYPLDKTEVARLYDQTRLLGHLVNDLHELAQAEAHQLPLHRMTVDLKTLVEDVVEMFTPVAEAEGVSLVFQTRGEIPTVNADSNRITQVLNNLLVNALRHTPAGGSISVCLEKFGDQVRLEVRDSGEGIPSEYLPHVFDRFYRVDRARSRASGGAGLGLAIVQAIVKAHGGAVSVSSEGVPGLGTTFTVQLPAA